MKCKEILKRVKDELTRINTISTQHLSLWEESEYPYPCDEPMVELALQEQDAERTYSLLKLIERLQEEK